MRPQPFRSEPQRGGPTTGEPTAIAAHHTHEGRHLDGSIDPGLGESPPVPGRPTTSATVTSVTCCRRGRPVLGGVWDTSLAPLDHEVVGGSPPVSASSANPSRRPTTRSVASKLSPRCVGVEQVRDIKPTAARSRLSSRSDAIWICFEVLLDGHGGCRSLWCSEPPTVSSNAGSDPAVSATISIGPADELSGMSIEA